VFIEQKVSHSRIIRGGRQQETLDGSSLAAVIRVIATTIFATGATALSCFASFATTAIGATSLFTT